MGEHWRQEQVVTTEQVSVSSLYSRPMVTTEIVCNLSGIVCNLHKALILCEHKSGSKDKLELGV